MKKIIIALSLAFAFSTAETDPKTQLEHDVRAVGAYYSLSNLFNAVGVLLLLNAENSKDPKMAIGLGSCGVGILMSVLGSNKLMSAGDESKND